MHCGMSTATSKTLLFIPNVIYLTDSQTTLHFLHFSIAKAHLSYYNFYYSYFIFTYPGGAIMIYHAKIRSSHCIILALFLIFCFPVSAKADIMSPDPDVIVISKDASVEHTDNETKPANALQNGTMRTGWIKMHGKKYYFDDKTGKMLTGWQQIDGYYYYLIPTGADKGSLQTNCIAGTKKDGFYYTDKTGRQIDTPEINAAVKFIKNYTKDHWTSAEKLQKCFEILQQHYYYLPSQVNPTAQKLSAFAYDLLTNERGNCYRYAAGFACIAKVLGYDCRIHIGNIDGRYGELLPHGWTEVKKDGIWCKCDVNMNLFMHSGTTIHEYKCLETYKLLTQNGKVYWKMSQN